MFFAGFWTFFARFAGFSWVSGWFRQVAGLAAVSLPLYLTPLLLTTGAYRHLPVSPQALAVSGELIREVVLHMQAWRSSPSS